jgi:hypothetical protein
MEELLKWLNSFEGLPIEPTRQNVVEKIWELNSKPLSSQGMVFTRRYYKMTYKPPFRVGKKQGKAVLDSNGLLVTFFEKSESQALLFCDYLNGH